MKNKNVGIATIIIVVLLAVLGFFYFSHVTTPVTSTIDTTPDVPVEAPEPNTSSASP
ncbi:hypothetical protein [Legionella brunensis]|uniref:Uncharacterized protein n=1 Tax=Legionella brunensis TaxID=29422 RepID=A0A0W0S458_9GAMM|nr:hypothetical protein [Legionella brunensis]KTC77860.1 hypothetical protein Lbru_2753 [Legionella brunensis]